MMEEDHFASTSSSSTTSTTTTTTTIINSNSKSEVFNDVDLNQNEKSISPHDMANPMSIEGNNTNNNNNEGYDDGGDSNYDSDYKDDSNTSMTYESSSSSSLPILSDSFLTSNQQDNNQDEFTKQIEDIALSSPLLSNNNNINSTAILQFPLNSTTSTISITTTNTTSSIITNNNNNNNDDQLQKRQIEEFAKSYKEKLEKGERFSYCVKCRVPFVPLSDLRFFREANGGIHLILIEFSHYDIIWYAVPNPQNSVFVPYKINCMNCKHSLGSYTKRTTMTHGFMICFDPTSVSLSKELMDVKKWRNVCDQFKGIIPLNDIYEINGISRPARANLTYLPTVFPQNITIADIKLPSNVVPYEHQVESFFHSCKFNSILVIPTGYGKTLISIMLINAMHSLNGKKHDDPHIAKRMALFLVTKVPLVQQQARSIEQFAPHLSVSMVCGGHYSNLNFDLLRPDVVVCTVDCAVNWLGNMKIAVEDFHTIVFDEAHHALGDHSYCTMVRRVMMADPANYPRILGLTASPCVLGKDRYSMRKEMENIQTNLNARIFRPTSLDSFEKSLCTMEPVVYSLTPMETRVLQALGRTMDEVLKSMQKELNWPSFAFNQDRMSSFQANLREMERYTYDTNKKTTFPVSICLTLCELVIKVHVEGIVACQRYLSQEKESHINKQAETDIEHKLLVGLYENIQKVLIEAQPELKNINNNINSNNNNSSKDNFNLYNIDRCYLESSKYIALVELLKKKQSSEKEFRGIIFVQMRSTTIQLTKMLQKESFHKELNINYLIGHNAGGGMDVVEQSRVLDLFKTGKCKLLVATNVLEEGLDVSECNLIVCFESDFGVRSMIQRRGRARSQSGNFLYLREEKQQDIQKDFLRREADMYKEINHLSKKVVQQLSKEEVVKKRDFIKEWNTQYNLILQREEEENLKKNSTEQIIVYLQFYHTNDLFNDLVFQIFGGGDNNRNSSSSSSNLDNIVSFEKISHTNEIRRYMSSSKLLSIKLEQPIPDYLTKLGCLDPSVNWWCSINNQQLPQQQSQKQPIEFSADVVVGMGNLDSPTFYQERCHLIDPLCKLIYQNHDRRILFRRQEGTIIQEIVIYNQDIEHFVLHDIMENFFYFVLKRPPRFIHKQQQGNEVVTLGRISGSDINQFCDNYVYRFKFTDPQQSKIFEKVVTQQMRIPKYYCNLRVESMTVDTDIEFDFKKDKKISYLLSVLKSNNGFGKTKIPQSFYNTIRQFLENGTPHYAEHLIYRALEASPFSKLVLKSKFDLDQFPNESIVRPPPTNYVYIKKCFVTPTRIIFQKPEIMQCNRSIRLFGADRFMQVQFVEENLDHKIELQPSLEEYTRGIMTKGIDIPGFGIFHYLGNSSSQARRNMSWFYCQDQMSGDDNNQSMDYSIDNVRSTLIGQVSNFQNPRKYLRAINLVFASTTPSIQFKECDYHENIPDVIRNGFNFTEGIGYIGWKTAQIVNEQCGYLSTTCAFQIRIGGNKGVVAVRPDIEYGLYLRNSMKKFKTESNEWSRTLEIVSIPSYKPCTLNRQVINLLSGLGVPDRFFLNLLSNALNDLASLLHNPKAAKRALSDDLFSDVSDSEILSDPMIRSTLHRVYYKRLIEYRDKSFIPIETARTLLGVTDETRTLKENQVFLQITNANGSLQIVTGLVAVAKNPCLHAGDVRLVEAVDIPSLHHMIDVVCFSQNGSVPVFQQCSGSDLDGDRYFVLFDKQMIDQIKQHEAYCGEELNAKASDETIAQNTLIDQYINNIQKGTLGMIALAHLAVCDIHSPKHPLALQLAIEHYKEVDRVKTGIGGEIPKDVYHIIGDQFDKFPNFMEKSLPQKSYWESEKILGRLYSQCVSLQNVIKFLPETKPDKHYLSEGWTDYKEDAINCFKRYRHQIGSLLKRYDIENEEDVLIQYVDETMSGQVLNKVVVMEIYNHYTVIQNNFREEFLRPFQRQGQTIEQTIMANQQEIEKKVSAWYYAAYSDTKTVKYLSFYWIVRKWHRSHETFVNKHNIKLSHDILGSLTSKQEELLSGYSKRLQVTKSIEQTLHTIHPMFKNCKLLMYGSTSLFLFNPLSSDLDLYIKLDTSMTDSGTTPEERSKVYRSLETSLKYNDVNIQCIEFVENAKFPIVRFVINHMDCDIQLDENGFSKTVFICAYFEKYPFLLPLVYTIVTWGRETGLLVHQDTPTSRNRTLKTWSLVWMVFHYALKCKLIQPIDHKPILEQFKVENNDDFVLDNQSVDWWIDVLKGALKDVDKLSHLLVGFYHYYTTKFSKLVSSRKTFTLMCPLDHDIMPSLHLQPSINLQQTAFFHEAFQLAYHSLSSMDSFLKQSIMQNNKLVMLDRIVSKHIDGSEDYFEQRLSLKTGANVKVTRIKKSRFQVKLSGDPYAIQLALTEITNITRNITTSPIHFTRSMVSGGGTTLLFEGSKNKYDTIKFIDCNRRSNTTHAQRRSFSPMLKNITLENNHHPTTVTVARGNVANNNNRESYGDDYLEYTKVLYSQLGKWAQYGTEQEFGETHAYIRFGQIYFINVPYSGFEKSIIETRKGLATSKRKNVKLQPDGSNTKAILSSSDDKSNVNIQSQKDLKEEYKMKEKISTNATGETKNDMKKVYGIENVKPSPMVMKQLLDKRKELEHLKNIDPLQLKMDVSVDLGDIQQQANELKQVDSQIEKLLSTNPKSSFLTLTLDVDQIDKLLVNEGWMISHYDQDWYAISLDIGKKSYKVEMNHDLSKIIVKLPNLNWFTADLKSLEEKGYDVRFSVQSKKDISSMTSDNNVIALLSNPPLLPKSNDEEMNTSPDEGQPNAPFTINPIYKKQITVVRHHKNQRWYAPPASHALSYFNIRAQLSVVYEYTSGGYYGTKPELELKIDLPKQNEIAYFAKPYWETGISFKTLINSTKEMLDQQQQQLLRQQEQNHQSISNTASNSLVTSIQNDYMLTDILEKRQEQKQLKHQQQQQQQQRQKTPDKKPWHYKRGGNNFNKHPNPYKPKGDQRDRNRSRTRSRSRDRNQRDGAKRGGGSGRNYRDRSRSRDRDMDRNRERYSDRRGEGGDRDRDRGRDRGRSRSRSRSNDRDRYRRSNPSYPTGDYKERDRGRSRSRSRERGGHGGRYSYHPIPHNNIRR